MSYGFRYIKAQYNYFPERTRPGGIGEVRCPDPKRPGADSKPGERRGDSRRPKGGARRDR